MDGWTGEMMMMTMLSVCVVRQQEGLMELQLSTPNNNEAF